MRRAMQMTMAALALTAAGATAQNYPTKPVRLLTAAAGGGNDFVARLLAPPLSAALGQQVIIDNRGGLLSAEAVARAAPDGYNILLTGSSFWIAPFFRDVSYDPLRDFTPVTQATSTPNLLVVHTSLPVKSVKELIALARARPGELNYAASSIGSPPHMAAELFSSLARVSILSVNFKGTGPAITGILGGHVEVMFAPAGAIAPHLKSGRLRALAVTAPRPTALAPGLPTVAATVPAYDVVSIIGVLAPARTPDALVERLAREITTVLQRPDVRERFFSAGSETVGTSPAEFGAAMKSEIDKWGRLVRSAKLGKYQ